MKLQNIIFPSAATCTVEDLYFRRNDRVEFAWSDQFIRMKKGAVVSLDTYFNSFSLSKWKKYSNVGSVFITLRFKGKLRVTLVRKERIGKEILDYYISETNIESQGEEITLKFDDPNVSGIFSAHINALAATEFYGGYYSSDIDKNKIHNIRIALDICTFKREHYIKRNLKLIEQAIINSGKYDEFKSEFEIFVIDNARTLNSEEFDLPNLRIFQNKNVGGSGGFTRGLVEIKKVAEKEKLTHALLMDDDIVIEPEVLFRTWTLLSLLKDEYSDAFISGAMLRLDRQYIQVESGALWNGGELIGRKCGLDLRGVEPCLYNEVEETIDYSAWWYTALPISIVDDSNLPLPLFIRGDDVEYGLRNARRVITINGICVWHEPFENKYSSSMFYYILRNRLIDNAIHDQVMPKKEFLNYMYHSVMGEIYLYRYKNARLLLEGVRDFLKGIDWLKGQDGERLHKRVLESGYKMQYMEDIGAVFDYGVYEHTFAEPEKLSFVHRIVKKLTINGILLKPKKANAVIPLSGGREINVYRAENVVNYDSYTQKGFITRRDEKEAKDCIRELKTINRMINEKYESINKQYKRRYRELTSMEFWDAYLQ